MTRAATAFAGLIGRLLLAGGVCAGLASAPALAAPVAAPPPRAASPSVAPGAAPPRVALALTGIHRRIPRSFLGLSTEANEVGVYESGGVLFDRVLQLIHAPDGSPLLLRIGGKSTDDAYWDVSPVGTPPWVFELDPSWMSRLAALVRRDDLRVMLDLNLAVHSPTMAAAFARAAYDTLPRRTLVGLGIGNEPDLYSHQLGLQRERIASTPAAVPTDWALLYSPGAYRSDYRSYARALLGAVPGVPLEGPDITSSTPRWISSVGGLGALGPSLITMHRYPFSSCWKTGSPFYPTLAGLLGRGASTGLARRLRQPLQLAAARGLPLRVTEINSVSCGGPAGVADSFATALWAPDALFELLKAGVVGVNWHIRTKLVNAPFHFVSGGIRPEPELYGLALFAQMLGPGAQLEDLAIANPDELPLKAWAVRSAFGVKLLLINKGIEPTDVALAAAGLPSEQGQVIKLTAPRLSSFRGVTLGGQSIGADGRWHGSRTTVEVHARRGLFELRVPAFSAQLLSLRS